LIFAHPNVDVDQLVFDETRRKLVAVTYIEDEPKRHFLDADAEREQAAIDHALPDAYNEVVSQNTEQTRAIVEISDDTHPPRYYAFIRDAQPKRLFFLLALYPDLRPEDLAPMRAVAYPARDGLMIPAYLTIPRGLEPKRLPVIVCPHGGPGERNYRRFDPEMQFLANRGFAVFQMNFRGSSGYGDQFRERGYRQWGLAMQDDVTDGVKWLIAQGIADPDRIGVYGSSYGGYAALMALVKTPELFRAGASYAGVSSLPTLLSDDQWYMLEDVDKRQIGGGWSDRQRLKDTSPVYNAARIRAPVLLAHGEDDERVHVKHSRMMAKALRSAGKEVEYLEFPHEHHGFLLEENRLRFYDRLGAFFEKHLAVQTPSNASGTEPATAPANR
jgi:dipeptidyl aminopeptidase/acylaminoacyl peptidase